MPVQVAKLSGKVTADVRDAQDNLRNVQNNLRETGDGFDRTGERSEQSMQRAGGATRAFGVNVGELVSTVGVLTAGVTAAGYATKKAFDFTEEGANLKQLEASFESVVGDVSAFREAVNGTVSDADLMSQSMTLLTGASGDLKDELATALPQLLEIAKASNKLNPALGDTTFLFESLAEGVKRGSKLRIDNAGIIVSQAEANEAYAETLGITADELTETQKKIALLHETVKEGQTIIEQAGNSAESYADAWAQARTTVKNTTDEMKQQAAEGVLPLIQRWNEFTVATRGTDKAMVGLFTGLDFINHALLGTSHRVDVYNEQVREQALINDLAAGQMNDYAEMARHLARAQEEAAQGADAGRYQAQADAIGTLRRQTDDAAGALNAYAEAGVNNIPSMEKTRQALANQAEAASDLSMSLMDASEQQIAKSLIDMLDPQEMGAGAYSAAVTEIGTAFGLMDEKSIALADNLPKVAEAIEAGIVPAQQADEALGALVEDAADGVVNFEDLLGQFEKAPDLTEGVGTTLNENLNPAMSTARDIAGEAYTNTDNWLQALNGLPDEKTVDLIVNYHTNGAAPSGVPTLPTGYASGGTIPLGEWGLVGEQGMELARATSSGTEVVPLGGGGGGGATWNGDINIHGGQDPQAIANVVMAELKRHGIVNTHALR
jgi:PAS domain-containing protein